jgi:hypothetical protein
MAEGDFSGGTGDFFDATGDFRGVREEIRGPLGGTGFGYPLIKIVLFDGLAKTGLL